jgi:hypothetical protein
MAGKKKISKEQEARSIKLSVDAGSDRFWAKRLGGDPSKEAYKVYNYGAKKKKHYG